MSHPIQLHDDEEVVATIRRHPLHLWARELAIAVVVLIVLFLWFRFGLGSTTETISTFWNIVAIAAVVIGLVLGYVYWYRYNNDLWLITSQRLVDSTRSTPFSQNVTTADLVNIQDISVRQRGISQTIFQYGDVQCQTASASATTFEFKGVADPQEVLEQIDKNRDRARRGDNAVAQPAPSPRSDDVEADDTT
jgi:uncharacterized membrane protein YdbT with pleckstrin-like domain